MIKKTGRVGDAVLLKKAFKTIKILLIVGSITAAIAAGAFFGYQWYQEHELMTNRPKEVLAKDGTNTNAAWHSLSEYQKQLRSKYPFIYKLANYIPPRTWVGKDFIIPGLRATKSYDFKKEKYNTVTKMTPQGLTVAGAYLLITAYDGDHQHASVIYVLNKNTGQYLKTIQVKGKPHLGGITYDPKGKNVWVTGSIGDSSALMSFPYSEIAAYHEKLHTPINYNNRISIPTLERASAVTYYDNQLFVGFFNMYGRGRVASYSIARNGKNKNSITNNEIKSVTGTISWSDPTGVASMNKQVQGIAIYDNKIFLSQSYGSGDSKLYIFPSTALDALSEKNAEKVVDMPPYLEQITAYKGQLLCLFESGSNKYAKPKIMIMDRILSININGIFGS